MQQKKYSFNYLIFKQDFIKRRMLVNPATHPVGVSVSEQTLPQCDQQVDNAVGLYAEAVTSRPEN